MIINNFRRDLNKLLALFKAKLKVVKFRIKFMTVKGGGITIYINKFLRLKYRRHKLQKFCDDRINKFCGKEQSW